MYKDILSKFYKNNKGMIITDCVVTLIVYALEIIVLSWISGMIFVNINFQQIKKFWIFTFLFILVFVIIVCLIYYTEYLDAYIVPSLHKTVREEIYKKTNDKSIGTPTIKSGELITKLTLFPYNMVMGYTNLVAFVLPFIIVVLFFIIYMFVIHWSIGLFSFFFLGVFLCVYSFFYVKTSRLSFNRYNLCVIQSNQFEDILSNFENVSLHNTYQDEKDRLLSMENKITQSFTKELKNISLIKMISNITLGVYMFIVIIMCSLLVIKKQIPIFKLVILTTATVMLLKTFEIMVRRCSDTMMEFGPLTRDRFSENISKDFIHKGDTRDFLTNYEIKFENVEYQIKNKSILTSVNLQIPYLDFVLITGEIGSGKSTILRLLCGYFYATNGKITLDNVDIKDIDIEYLRDNVTMMHQSITLFKRPVLENIFYGSKIPKEKQMEKIKELKIYTHVEKFINLDDSQKLSGGQKQIVLLLRCYFRNTKIILMDEPTASVDSDIKKVILDIIFMLKKQSTIICISHDTSIFHLFKTHYILKKGSLFLKSK